jgi:nicotinamidase-related amidase
VTWQTAGPLICVSTTTRMAAILGFEVVVVADGTATFARVGHDGRAYSADEVHRLALASLHGEFATVIETAAVLAGSATHTG